MFGVYGRRKRRREVWRDYMRPLAEVHKWGDFGGGMCAMVAECCAQNDAARLGAFFSQADVANRLLKAEGGQTYSFRFFSRLLLRATVARHLAVADVLVNHLAISSNWPTTSQEEVADLHQRFGKQLLTHFSDHSLKERAPAWIRTLDQDTLSPRWRRFAGLFGNEGGDGSVWQSLRASSRAMIAQRFFCTNKASLNETYIPYFSDRAYSPETIRILATDCKVFVSRGQLFRNLYNNSDDVSYDVLNAVLETWREVTKPDILETLRINCDDLERLLLIGDPQRRHQRLDIITSAGNVSPIQAEQLQRFHLASFADHQNPVPWIHTKISIGKELECWNNIHIIAFYLQKQMTLRQTTTENYSYLVDAATQQCIPKELRHIIASYLVSHLQHLVLLDSTTTKQNEAAAILSIWRHRPPTITGRNK